MKVLGNWEDSLWRAMRGMLDETRSSHRYLMRQCQYILEEITPQEIEAMQDMPMQVHREIAGLKIGQTRLVILQSTDTFTSSFFATGQEEN